MQFQVPQFIEHEPKVIGPFTFRQFLYLAIPGAVAFFLYFTAPFMLFVIGSVILFTIGFALGFLKMGGQSLSSLMAGFLGYSVNPKTYIWKESRARKNTDVSKEYKRTTEQEVVASQIQVGNKSRVQDLGTQIETKR